jgi:hypothetical protein
MTEKLGNQIPPSSFSVLSSENSARTNDVIILLTLDENGFSRPCLLSPFQVVATDRAKIYFEVYSESHTKLNLDRTGKAEMILQDSTGLLYLRGETRFLRTIGSSQAESQSLYSMTLLEVSRDVSEVAPINSHLTFDTSVIGSQYQKSFEAMRDYLKSNVKTRI